MEQADFVQLISANKGIIIKICNSYCVNAIDREDLAQEIIFSLWKGSKKYDPDYKFSTWMYRVALNVAISFYRYSKKRANTIPFSDQHLEIEDPSLDHPSSDSSTSEANFSLLQKHIYALKDLDKALIILYFEEKSYKEIAEIMGISETNVATKVSRIKERLKHSISSAKK
jgi:RNA polymerase sigma-70 factor (ECF subfamily)